MELWGDVRVISRSSGGIHVSLTSILYVVVVAARLRLALLL